MGISHPSPPSSDTSASLFNTQARATYAHTHARARRSRYPRFPLAPHFPHTLFSRPSAPATAVPEARHSHGPHTRWLQSRCGHAGARAARLDCCCVAPACAGRYFVGCAAHNGRRTGRRRLLHRGRGEREFRTPAVAPARGRGGPRVARRGGVWRRPRAGPALLLPTSSAAEVGRFVVVVVVVRHPLLLHAAAAAACTSSRPARARQARPAPPSPPRRRSNDIGRRRGGGTAAPGPCSGSGAPLRPVGRRWRGLVPGSVL